MKTCFIIFLCTLLCPLTACYKTTHPLSSNTPTPLPMEEVLEEPSDVWDVSDVDISEIDTSKKLISFTFDDAPAVQFENILAVFASFNESNPDCKAFATVFCNGHLCSDSSLLALRTAYAMGFELGNHTHSHFDLTSLSELELNEEIDATDRILEKIDGKSRHLLRAPFGKINEEVKEVSSVPLIDWTIDTLDWTGIPEEDIFEKVFANKQDGHIVLMHDGNQATVDALKRLLPVLKEEGYQVVSVSQLAKAHGCVLKRGKVYIRARKQF